MRQTVVEPSRVMITASRTARLNDIEAKVRAGDRVSYEEGVFLAEEADLSLEALEGWWDQGDGACLLINSLGCRPIRALEGRPLPLQAGEPLWRALVGDGA